TRHVLEEADGKGGDFRHSVVEPQARPVTLIGREIAFRREPRLLTELRILEDVRSKRTAGDVFAVEITPQTRERVVAADVRAAAHAIGRRYREALVAALQVVGVLRDPDIRRRPERI